METENFINDVVRSNFRSLYMTTLYGEKSTEKYLTEEDKDDYLANCAILSATSRIMSPIFKRLLSDIPVSQLNELGRKILSDNVSGYERIVGRETSMEEMQDIKKEGNSGIYALGGGHDDSYYFGNVDPADMRKVLGNDQWRMFGYHDLYLQSFSELLGCSNSEQAVEKLSEWVVGIDSLPVDEQIALFDKISICFERFSTSNERFYLADREYSKRKYPNDASTMDKCTDFKEACATVGIDMGEMPKTIVGEVYGYEKSASDSVTKH